MSTRSLFAIAVLILGTLWWLMNRDAPPQPTQAKSKRTQTAAPPPQTPAPSQTVQANAAPVEASVPAEPETVTQKDPQSKKPVLPYKMKHGLIVVQGDSVVGVPTRPDAPETGYVIIPPLKLWRGGIVPYHIQPNLPNPERVQEAIALFDGTAIHFTPYNNEENVLVFESGDQDCLSYVGQMGGKQPVWISPECRPADIAHEILHALGFVHEQNRSDRDNFVEVNFDNIDERYTDNFEKLSPEFMRVTGLGEFDFQSLMIYPPWMFAKNGQSTMLPKIPDKLIQPGSRLSAGDIDRLNRAYAK